jgi:hypothetical protein
MLFVGRFIFMPPEGSIEPIKSVIVLDVDKLENTLILLNKCAQYALGYLSEFYSFFFSKFFYQNI